jgi:hypothetical protein
MIGLSSIKVTYGIEEALLWLFCLAYSLRNGLIEYTACGHNS